MSESKGKTREWFDVQRAVADCVIACLWNENCPEATCETEEHRINAWRVPDDGVIAKVEHR